MKFPIRNAGFLFLRLAGNQLLPLAALPILYTRLGPHSFGLFLLAQAVLVYITVLVDYGFSITGVREVATIAARKTAVPGKVTDSQHEASLRHLFGAIVVTRLLICLCLCIVFAIFAMVAESDSSLLMLTSISLFVAVGTAIQPLWYLQGVERFGLVSGVQFVSKLLSLLAVLTLVHRPEDLLLAHFVYSSSLFVAAWIFVISAWSIDRDRRSPKLGELRTTVAEWLARGFPVFLSQAATTLFTSTNVLVVGAILGPSAAGHFGLGDKVIRGLASLGTPLTEALFPRVSARISSEPVTVAQYLGRLLRVLALPLLAATSLVALSSHLLAFLIAGGKADPSVAMAISLMAPIPALVFVNNIMGTQILLGLGHAYSFMRIVILSGALVPLCSAVLLSTSGFVGAPIGALAGEIAIVVLMYHASCKAVGRNWLAPVKSEGAGA